MLAGPASSVRRATFFLAILAVREIQTDKFLLCMFEFRVKILYFNIGNVYVTEHKYKTIFQWHQVSY